MENVKPRYVRPVLSKIEGWDSKAYGRDHYYINNRAICDRKNMYHEPYFNPYQTVEMMIESSYLEENNRKDYCGKCNKILLLHIERKRLGIKQITLC